jgi:glucose-1-phosphate thymidylyltransferase
MSLKKIGILLAGGRGTRLAVQTEIHNKHLLPVYTHQGAIPMIWYPLNTLISSGCEKIIIISSQEHCGDIMEFLGDGKRFGPTIDISYKIQDHNSPSNPVGIASAMKLIEGSVDEISPFMVILGDNFFEDSFKEQFSNFCDNVSKDTAEVAHVFLKPVIDPERFGCAKIVDGRIIEIVEKPKGHYSNLAVTGVYFFTGHVFKLLPSLKVSNRGELEVSHINDWYVKQGRMDATIIDQFWCDLGTIPSMLCAQSWINDNRFSLPSKWFEKK